MWCTRWFLPLVILPLPTAPPYFLAVFLISVFLHARPCFYCMMLLTFLFTTSCYWQAVPIDGPLSRPVGGATTFGEAILANLSLPDVEIPGGDLSSPSLMPTNANANSRFEGNLTMTMTTESMREKEYLPPVIQLMDRCWCNIFSRNGLFEPTDVSRWEMESVLAVRKGIEARLRDAVVRDSNSGGRGSGGEVEEMIEEKRHNGETGAGVEGGGADGVDGGSSFSLRGLRELLFPTVTPATAPKYRLKHASASPSPASVPDSSEPSEPIATSSPPFYAPPTDTFDDSDHDGDLNPPESPLLSHTDRGADASPITDFTSSPPTATERLKLLRPYYDFRPYGIDITLDFRWDRDAHTHTQSNS